jgi:uncharacterized tellurite resistance protein B-like protein
MSPGVDRVQGGLDIHDMLTFLERILRGGPAGPVPEPGHRQHLAAAALLVEAARVDGRFEAEERREIQRLLEERFHLDPVVALDLLEEAESAAERSTDWQGFTRVLNDAFDQDGRIAILEMLWEVIDADGRVDTLEASLMRRLGALMYVSDRDNGEARQRARAREAARVHNSTS